MCVFCNQRSISGHSSFCREDVANDIERALDTLDADADVEIAYFGGSFTGIERDLMIYLLELARHYVDEPLYGKARISGIRMSTRPDYINGEIMEILSRYPVKTIELGLQSMDDEVLRLSERGHTSADAENACKAIREAGYALVGQMMVGLPGSTLEKEIETAKKICDMGATGARIYPTVTFFDTKLADMAERGEYEMLSNDDAVMRSKEVLKIFESRGVECIRIGLCASDNLGDMRCVKGGANHPALGELVIGELYYDKMCELIDGQMADVSGSIITFDVPRGELSKAIGQHGKNKKRLLEKYSPKRLIIKEADIPNLTLSMSRC